MSEAKNFRYYRIEYRQINNLAKSHVCAVFRC